MLLSFIAMQIRLLADNGKVHSAMQEASTKRIYDLQSVVYEATFGRLVKRRVENAVSHMNIGKDDLVLDLGIGTGASLNFFPRDRGRIVGIDLSSGMLRYCRQKIREWDLRNVNVFQANALELPFADNVFDHVFISHVISVVSDPVALVKEAQRVAKPGAKILILNHFQSTNRLIALIEKWLCPMFIHLGWRSDLALQDVIRGTGMEIDYRYKLGNIDLWETVVTHNDKSALRGQLAMA
jgi:phosphatidylethanolamine/phosphatidyl-N-methylethanolamine N-methyltransferase